MKNFKIEIKTNQNTNWDADAVQDCISAESTEEAVEIAKMYLIECTIQYFDENRPYKILWEEIEKIKNNWIFKATEV